uniref:HEAT repeat-containing protein 6 n=1 Tax=Phallusia mammillata TaxID=59560 RepID=A0A6F9DF21_9ASCI|nr:HEAT repeat-containing protein 6-like [Phallusia mammillata]
MVLSAMVEGSKQFLSLVCKESVSTSFVPFSGLITSAIHACHETLLTAIGKERSLITQVHILKALASIAGNTPYSKLQHGIIGKMIINVRLFMQKNPDADSQIAALNVFVALFSHDPALEEVACGISDVKYVNTDSSPFSRQLSKPLSTTKQNFSSSWLVDHCLELLDLENESVSLSLRVASLQTLTACCKPYFVLAKPSVAKFKEVIYKCMHFDKVNIRLHACKLLEMLGTCLLHNSQGSEHSSVDINDNVVLWDFLLSGPLQNITQSDEDPIIRSHLCDCLSTIGPSVFEMLSRKLQVFCQTVLLGYTSDDNYLVRSAAVRSLAVHIMYPFLRKDIAFVEDVASCILRLMHDPIKSVQCNAAWSFGNLTDAIIVSVEADETFRDRIGNKTLLDLFENAVEVIDNKDKVRFNIMRVLGNLLRFCTNKHLQVERLTKVMLKAVNIVATGVTKDSLMKVRWNACLACGNFLNNVNLPIGKSEWTDLVYDALCEAVSKSKNYKVRIKAAAALSCVQSRANFGLKFNDVCSCITQSLQNLVTETTQDFEEFRFHDRLSEQLCCTLLHLVKLMQLEDFQIFVLTFPEIETYVNLKEQLGNCYDGIQKRLTEKSEMQQECMQEAYIALGQLLDKDKMELFKFSARNWNVLLEKDLKELEAKNFNYKCLTDVFPNKV